MSRASPSASDRTARSRPSGRLCVLLALALALAVAAAVLAAPPAPSPVHAQESTQVPTKPAGLAVTATAGSLDVDVDWDDVDGAADYLVRWRLAGPGQALNAGVRPSSSSTQITVAAHGTWVVRVQACNDAGCGGATASQFQVTAPPPPAKPANLALVARPPSGVTATWNAVAGATSYRLGWRSLDDAALPGGSLEVRTASATAAVAGSGE